MAVTVRNINFFIMNPIEILKKGLTRLRNQVQDRKTRLLAELRASRPISDTDQEWLDNDGNLVDEERVVDVLDCASDYEEGLRRLNSHDKYVVDKLQSLVGSTLGVVEMRGMTDTKVTDYFVCK